MKHSCGINCMEDLDVGGKIALQWISHLFQDRDQWRALVNTVMKFRVL